MKILVVGGGAREHALVWTLAASPRVRKIWCAPGNAGIAAEADCPPIPVDDLDALVAFATEQAVDLVVIGPELPLTLGLADRLTARGIAVFGPSAAAARIEGSKGFMKDLAARAGVPTAAYRRVTTLDEALATIAAFGAPVVVKADGLAAGKGVTVAMTLAEAEAAARDALTGGKFGAAGAELVIEQYLEGEEVSYFALSDGTHILPLASAQDHKRAFDGDQGPNTGGMGAYSPAPCLTPAIEARVLDEIIRPTVRTMAEMGCPYKGVLFAGLMLTRDGPKLIEFNARFGDPECQVLMLRLHADLLPALLATHDGTLDQVHLDWRADPALTVVYAGAGYPGTPKTGGVIGGLAAADAIDGVKIFHAATRRDPDGTWRAAGGRVLAVSARADDLPTARARAYAALAALDWPEGFYRRDIAWRALDKTAS